MPLIYTGKISMETVRRELFETQYEGKDARIWFSLQTCWWTHRFADLHYLLKQPRKPNEDAIYTVAERQRAMMHAKAVRQPLLLVDPTGGNLKEHLDPEGFLAYAESQNLRYGRHGVTTFMAGHNANVTDASGRPWASVEWKDYDDAIDKFLRDHTPKSDEPPPEGPPADPAPASL